MRRFVIASHQEFALGLRKTVEFLSGKKIYMQYRRISTIHRWKRALKKSFQNLTRMTKWSS